MLFECVREPKSAKYQILALDGGTTLQILIPGTLWLATIPLLISPMRRLMEGNLNIPDFIQPGILPWGFGPILSFEEDHRSPWRSILCELPNFTDTSSSEFNWQKARATIASLEHLLRCVEYASTKNSWTSHGVQQILEVSLGVHSEPTGITCFICAGFSSSLCTWLMSQQSQEISTSITQDMTNAYCRMYGKDGIDSYTCFELRAEIRDSIYATLPCPGDRTTLYPTSFQQDTNGYELGDHNVDTPLQQLTLLVGLASLWSRYKAFCTSSP